MGSILAFRNKKQHEVSRRFLACVAPNHIYRVDHINNKDSDCVSRVVITKTEDQFCVNHYQTRLSSELKPKEMRVSTLHSFECHAKEQVEQIVTCLELEDWEFLQEIHLTLYDVNARYLDYRITLYCTGKIR